MDQRMVLNQRSEQKGIGGEIALQKKSGQNWQKKA
jgi:hypothetical protein